MMNKAIDIDVISVETACPICSHEYTAVFADHELAQLRADLQAARDERDEAKAWHISLNAMIDRKNATIAEQARQLDEANRLIRVINQRIYLKRDLQVEVNHWLAVNPAPSPDEQRCTCGTGDATMPEYHAAGCALKAEPQP